MSNEVVKQESQLVQNVQWTEERKKSLYQSMMKGASDDEFFIFMEVCKRTGLDPFVRQIYAVPRNAKQGDGSKAKTWTYQVSIDGMRLIAERTKIYMPGREPTFVYDKDGRVQAATAYVKRWSSTDSQWHEISATAIWSEYMVGYNGQPNNFWATKPHLMLAKCAESLVLRKAFPADLSGIYTEDEMGQAANDVIVTPVEDEVIGKAAGDALSDLLSLDRECEKISQELLASAGIQTFDRFPKSKFDLTCNWLRKRRLKQSFEEPTAVSTEVVKQEETLTADEEEALFNK